MTLKIAAQGNAKWVKLGCAMLTTLLASPEGVRLLSSEDEFLPQITMSFAQLDPVWRYTFFLLCETEIIFQFNGSTHSDPILSKRRVADTLTYGYLEMLGTLSKHKEGIECVPLSSTVFRSFFLTPMLPG